MFHLWSIKSHENLMGENRAFSFPSLLFIPMYMASFHLQDWMGIRLDLGIFERKNV